MWVEYFAYQAAENPAKFEDADDDFDLDAVLAEIEAEAEGRAAPADTEWEDVP